MKIPCIVIELASKLQLTSKEVISIEELISKNSIINEFIIESQWKHQVIENSSILDNINLGKLVTHWWTGFTIPTPGIPPVIAVPPIQTTAVTPPLASTIINAASMSIDSIAITEEHQKRLPTIKVMPLRHR